MSNSLHIGDVAEITTTVSNDRGDMSFRKSKIIVKNLPLLSDYPTLVNSKKLYNGNNKVH